MDRDHRIDTLRGLLLVIMTIDHLNSPISSYTHEGLGFVSALEGFLFLSGFTCAAVYMTETPRPARFGRMLRRAWTIYRCQLVLVLMLPLLTISAAQRSALADWVQPYLSHPVTYFGLALLGLHQPVYMDILPKYVLLLLISPVLLSALQRGLGAGVLLVSALVWAAVQIFGGGPGLVASVCADCRQGPEDLMAWQLVWIAGMYCGYRYRKGAAVVPGRALLVASAFVVTVLFLARHAVVNLGVAGAATESTLGWLRVLDLAAIGLVLGGALQDVPRRYGLPWLALLGRSSLQVFAFHVFLMYSLLPFRDQLLRVMGNLGFTLFTFGILGTLTLPAVVHQWYRSSRTPAQESAPFVSTS